MNQTRISLQDSPVAPPSVRTVRSPWARDLLTFVSRAGVPAELVWGIGGTYSLSRHTDLLLQAGSSLRGTHDLNLHTGVLTRLNR